MAFFENRKASESHVELLNLKGGILSNFIYAVENLYPSGEKKSTTEQCLCLLLWLSQGFWRKHLQATFPQIDPNFHKRSLYSEWSVGLGFVHSTCVRVFLSSYCLNAKPETVKWWPVIQQVFCTHQIFRMWAGTRRIHRDWIHVLLWPV